MPFSNIGQARQGVKLFNQPSIEERTKESKDRLNQSLSGHFEGINNRRYKQQPERGRSAFMVAIDLLSTGTYASAGFAKGIVNKDVNPLVGMAEGISAGFTGKEEYRHTYSRVMDDMGWQPETTKGKVVRGAVGLLGDIFLDPATYLTGGAIALMKGSGKATAKVTHNMTRAMGASDALPIARGFFSGKGIKLTVKEMGNASEVLARTMNAKAGFAKQSTPLRLAFEGAPFGKKIFGKHASKGIELVSAETMGRIGDNTFAPVYRVIRDTFFGSKMGDLFSTQKLAYQASKESPEALLQVIAPKIRKDMLKMQSRETFAIFKKRGDALDFDEATTREIFDALEDPSVWNKMKNMLAVRDIDEAGRYVDRVHNRHKISKKQATKLRDRIAGHTSNLDGIAEELARGSEEVANLRGQMDSLIASGKPLKRQEIKALHDQIYTKQRDVSKIKSSFQHQNNHLNNYNKSIENLELLEKSEHLLTPAEAKKVRGMEDGIRRFEIGVKNLDKKIAELEAPIKLQQTSIVDKARSVDDYNIGKLKMELKKSNFSKQVDLFTPEGTTLHINRKNAIQRKLSPQQVHKGELHNGEHYITYARKDTAVKLSELTGWERGTLFDGTHYVNVPNQIVADSSMKLSGVATSKIEVVGDIGEYAFGDKNMLSENITGKAWDDLIKKVKNGSPEDVRVYIDQNKHLMRKDTEEMYSFVAKQFEYKSFKGNIVDDMKELGIRVKNGDPTLTKLEIQRFNKLEDIYTKRQYMVNSLKKLDPAERTRLMRDFQDERLMDELSDVLDRKRGFSGTTDGHQKLKSRKVDSKSIPPQDADLVNPSQAEEHLLRMKAKSNGALKPDDWNALYNEKKVRFKNMERNLDKGSLNKIKPYKDNIDEAFKERPKIGKHFDAEIAKLESSKPAGYQRKVVDAKKEKHKALNKARENIDATIDQYDKALKEQLNYEHLKKHGAEVNTVDDLYRREVEVILDEKKAEFTTDLYDAMVKKTPNYASPDSLTERDVFFLEEAYDAFVKKVKEGNFGKMIDVENLTNDQYARLLDGAIDDVLSGLQKKTIKSGKGSMTTAKKIKGVKTVKENAVEALKKRADKAKKISPNVSEQIKKVSKMKEDTLEQINRTRTQIDEVYALSEEANSAGIQREIKGLKNRIKMMEPDMAKNKAKITELQGETGKLSQRLQDSREAQEKISKINKRLQASKRNMDDLENLGAETRASLHKDTKQSEIAIKKYEKLEKILDDDRLLSEFVMDTDNRVITHGEKQQLLAKYETIEYVMKEDVPMADRTRELVNMMRKDLQQMGMDEVRIGKLTSGQFEHMVQSYLPRVVTEEGHQFFNAKLDAEGVKRVKGFGDTFGFGKEFNPHGKSRQIKALYNEAGNVLKENPSLREINEHFAKTFPELKGKNVFSDNLQELFNARAKKHVDLMYDHQYMNEITDMFGVKYEPWEVGRINTMTTANIGRYRQDTSNYAKIDRQMVIDDAVDGFIHNHKYKRYDPFDKITKEYGVIEDLQRIVNEKSHRYQGATGNFFTEDRYQLEFKKLMERRVQAFTKSTFPESIKRDMIEETMQTFMNNTDTVGYLDDLSMPFLEFNDKQARTIHESISNLKARRLDHIKAGKDGFVEVTDTATGELIRRPKKKGMTKFILDLDGGVNAESLSKRIADADSVELHKILDEYVPRMDRFDYNRYQGYINKIDTLDNLKNDTLRSVPQGLTDRFNNSRKLQIQRDNSAMLGLWDKMTKLIKLNQTTVLPNFHAKNKFGNTFRNMLELGGDATDFTMQKKTLEVVRNKGKVAGGFDIVRPDGSKGYMSWTEAWDMADDVGVTSGGWFSFDGSAGGGVANKLGLKAKLNPLDADNFIPYRKGASVGKVVEDQDRFLHFVSKMKKGANVHEAAESSQKFLFDYGDLTFFEQSTMKRIMPFYTWMRKNTPLQMEMMLEKPGIYQMVSKIYRGVEGMNNEDDLMDNGFVNEFAQDWVQTPFTVNNAQGREEKVLWNPNLPFMDISNLPNVFRPKQSLKNMFSKLNPLITQPIEHAFNKNVFFDSEIVGEEDNAVAKRIDHTLRQLTPYNLAKGMVQKEGGDRLLHAWNNATGIRFLSYDYNMYRAMKLEELSDMTNQEYFDMMNERTWEYRKKQKIHAPTRSFAGKMSRAMSGVTRFVDGTKPTPAGMYDGALRPISQTTFNELSESDQSKYIPPDNETAWAYHKQAVELEREAHEESRAPVRFVWGLFDNVGVRKENHGEYSVGRVTNIVDGDTFDIDVGGEIQRIRPLLVDTPELDTEEPYAEEATEFADEFLFDKDVRIIFDGNNVDMYGRTLGYVELPGEGVDYNRELLERGYATTAYRFEPHYNRLVEYNRAERQAKRKGIRLHGK